MSGEMRALTRVLVALAAVAISLLASPATASADPANPCDLALSFFCRFVPIMPNLEGDIDLSTQLPPAPPGEPPRPADICARGCL
jgi:hypothetical protein